MKINGVKNSKARLVAMIHRGEMDLIDRIGKDALFTAGKKLSRAEVVSAILNAVAQLPINGKDMHSQQELREYIGKVIEDKANEKEGK